MNIISNLDNSEKVIGTYSYLKDDTFREIISKITPMHIDKDNKNLLQCFGDMLSTLSIPSVNITDVFHKEKNELNKINFVKNAKYMKNIQDTINQTFINDFWATNNDYYKSYLINNELEDIIYRYSLLEDIPNDLDTELYKNFFQLFTEDKYLGHHDFKIKKGSKTALEYAYHSLWDAQVEGVFRESYYFNVRDTLNLDPYYNGFCINPLDASFTPDPNYNPFPDWYDNPYPYPPQEPYCDDPVTCTCTETSHRIGTFIISSTPNSNLIDLKEPFKYWVTGNMLPIFYHTMVKDLAHPVGFEYNYNRIFYSDWEDTFNLEILKSADNVIVRTLCYNGDCSDQRVEYYSSKTGELSITDSNLKNLEIYPEYKDGISFDVQKYIFENDDILIQYTNKDDSNFIEIEYYNNDFSNIENILNNGDFDSYGYWSFGDRWYLDITNETANLVNTSGTNDILTQTLSVAKNKNYVVEIKVLEIEGEIAISLNNIKNFEINKSGRYFIRFKNYVDSSVDVIIEDILGNSTCVIDSVKICEDIPTKFYPNFWHSSIEAQGLKNLRPISTTREEMTSVIDYGDGFGDMTIGDNLNDMPNNLPQYPIIGENITIGQSELDTNSLYSFKIGCYLPQDGPFPPYLDTNDCCTPNIPHNPPSWNPGDPCILGEIIVNNPNLTYVQDLLEIETPVRTRYDIVDIQGFDNWTVISGNATIVDGVISQDGTEESVIERDIDTCIYEYDVIGFNFISSISLSPEINIGYEYIDSDGTIIFTGTINCLDLSQIEFMVKNAFCNATKPKVRITLPIDFELSLSNSNLYKY